MAIHDLTQSPIAVTNTFPLGIEENDWRFP